MTEIRFSAPKSDIPEYVLNHNTESPFEKHNIRFRIEGHYLTDFSEKGIENFIEKHYNDQTGLFGWGGKDLELADVKAFIQTVAANADKVAGATFDLTDPQLGLFDDDKIKAKDLKSSFSVNFQTPPGSSATEVSFVDAGSVKFHRADFDQAKKEYLKAKEKFNDAADQIGGDAANRMVSLDSELKTIKEDLKGLRDDIQHYRQRIQELKSQGTSEDDSQIRQLNRAIRGIEMEQEDLKKREKQINKDLNEKHGFFLFRWFGGGSSMSELRQAKTAMDAAEKKMNAAKAVMDGTAPPPQAPQEADREQNPSTPPPAETSSQPTQAAAPFSTQDFARLGSTVARTEALLQLSPAQQYQYLEHIPEADRAAQLKTFDDYIAAGHSSNPLGLPPQEFEQVKQAYAAISQLRLTALLKWGEPAQASYVDGLSNEARDAFRKELEEKILAAASEKNLLNQLGLSDKDKEALRAQAQKMLQQAQPKAAAPTQAPAPTETPVQTQPQPIPTQAETPPVQTPPPVRPEVQQPVPQQPSQPVKDETPSTPPQPVPGRDPFAPHDSVNPPVTEEPATEPAPPVETPQPTPPTQRQTPPRTPRTTQPQRPAPTTQPTQAQAPTPAPTAAQKALSLANVLWAKDLELKVQNQNYQPTDAEQKRHEAISAIYMEEMAWAQGLDQKVAANGYQPTEAERQRYEKIFNLTQSLNSPSSQPAAPQPTSTPSQPSPQPTSTPTQPSPQPSSSRSTQPSQPPQASQPTAPVVEPVKPAPDTPAPTAPTVAEPPAPVVRQTNEGLATQKLTEITAKLKESHHSSTDVKQIQALSQEVWNNGSLAQRQSLAKLLVTYSDDYSTMRGDYYGLLYDMLNPSPLMGKDMAAKDVGDTVARTDFPVQRFMAGLSDSQASGLLRWVATSGSPGAKAFIETTLKAYTGTIKDREQPFKELMADVQAAQAIQAMGLKDQVEKLLK